MKNTDHLHTFIILAFKKSPFLESCILSLKQQTFKSTLVIATSTPNSHINALSQKYQISVIENPERRGIGFDFDFALGCAQTDWATIAHQDDLYEKTYTEKILKNIDSETIIAFSDYYEIKNGIPKRFTRNLLVKKALLFFLRWKIFQKMRFFKRACLSFGNPICCPAVTFPVQRISLPLFSCELSSNMDWMAWEKISQKKGRFVFVPQALVGHRIHKDSTTSKVIQENNRSSEDFFVLQKFWPKYIAKIIARIYKIGEKNNAP